MIVWAFHPLWRVICHVSFLLFLRFAARNDETFLMIIDHVVVIVGYITKLSWRKMQNIYRMTTCFRFQTDVRQTEKVGIHRLPP